MSETYVHSVVEERLLYTARVRGELSGGVVGAYDFRALQGGLMKYVSSLKSLLLTVPRDVLGDGFVSLYRRVGGLEPLIMRATDVTQLLRYLDAADDAFVDIVNALFRAGVIRSIPQRP